MNVVQKFFTDIIELSELRITEQQIGARRQAFREIAAKIQAMPFNDATIDSFLVWLKEQE